MDELWKIAAAAVVCAFAALLLRRQTPEFAFLAAFAAGLGILLLLLPRLSRVHEALVRLSDSIPGGGEFLAVMGKAALSLCVTHLAAQNCLDCEQKALAAKVELAGAIACLYAALPLAEALFAQIGALL